MIERYVEALDRAELVRRTGEVRRSRGLVIEANGPDGFVGELCTIQTHDSRSHITAEIIGIQEGSILLMPFAPLQGVRLGTEVVATGARATIPVSEALLGRVIDAFGQPLDDGPPIEGEQRYPLYREPINPLQRPPIDTVLETGIRALDTLMTIGRGQRIAIFAGSGVGKSTFLGMIGRYMNADVNVIAMIGERGREVLDFIHQVLGEEGLKRSVVVVATSDQPALVRAHAALAATAIAEYFRDNGRDVVLTMDSVTRFAMAQREIGLAVGEPPTTRGYPPSVFSVLPCLLERCGRTRSGSITAFYTVLVEGDDLNDPVADHVRATVDGGVVLSRQLANRRHFPSIDVLHSHSRLINVLASEQERQAAAALIQVVDTYERSRDLVDMGAYKRGTNEELDRALQLMPAVNTFLQQPFDQCVSRKESSAALAQLISQGGFAQ